MFKTNTGDTNNHTCGHPSNVPNHMGRGQARVKRITVYYGRPCGACRIAAAERRWDVNGMRGIGIPGKPGNFRPTDDREAFIRFWAR